MFSRLVLGHLNAVVTKYLSITMIFMWVNIFIIFPLDRAFIKCPQALGPRPKLFPYPPALFFPKGHCYGLLLKVNTSFQLLYI